MSASDLMAGYARYATADEVGTAAVGEAPATLGIISTISVLSSFKCALFSASAVTVSLTTQC